MTDKQLGWASVGGLGLYLLFYFNSPDGGTTEFIALAWVVLSVWASIRLINK